MKIGIFGGTFNPPHLGHLIVAEHAREQLGLGKVVFIPAAVPPHKRHAEIIESHHRLEMLHRALEGNHFFAVSDLELRRGGVSFTVETLEALQTMYPNDSLCLLIGADNLPEFHTWRDPEKILALADVVALTRPGFGADPANDPLRKRISICPVPAIEIEARQIRRKVRDGKSIRYLVPPAVEEYILIHRLYR